MTDFENNDLPLADELLIQAYLDGELTPAEWERFSARLAAEPVLRDALEVYAQLFAAVEEMVEPALSRDLETVVVNRLAAGRQSVPFLRRLALIEILVGVMVLLLAWPVWQVSAGWLANQGWLQEQATDFLNGNLARLAEGITGFDPAGLIARLAGYAELRPAVAALLPGDALSLELLLPLALVTGLVWVVSTHGLWSGRQGGVG